MEEQMGARLMNARKKKKRLAHRDSRQKSREQAAAAEPASKPKGSKAR
jgi:hypothetical protein